MSYTPFLMSVINECVSVPVSCVHKNERFSNLSLVSFLFSGFSPSGTAEGSCPPCYHPIIPSSDKTYEISTHKKKHTQKKRSIIWRMASIYHTIPYHTIITLPPPINLRQKPTLTHTLPHHSIVTSVAPRSLSLFIY